MIDLPNIEPGAFYAPLDGQTAELELVRGRKSRRGRPERPQEAPGGVSVPGIGWVAAGAIIVLDGRRCRVLFVQGQWWCYDL